MIYLFVCLVWSFQALTRPLSWQESPTKFLPGNHAKCFEILKFCRPEIKYFSLRNHVSCVMNKFMLIYNDKRG